MTERAFLYGDLIFETIRVRNGDICFIDKHYSRLSRSANLLKFDTTYLSKEIFEEDIRKALGDKKDARVRFLMYRDSKGFYTPETNNSKWEIEIFPLETEQIICGKLGVFNQYKKTRNELSNLKSGNALLHVMAGIYAKENYLDDCLILNQHGRVAETIHSNIFILRGDELVTPPLTEGCVEGVMRQVVIEIALFKGIFLDEIPILPHELIQADEVFLTNA
ncbi:MAG: aminotransferase class IV, partial [Bacteroidia bacterium]